MNLIINNIFGWVLILGTIISYSPQYIKLYNLKSSKGIANGCLFLVD